MPTKSTGTVTAMKFFGKLPGQKLAEFKAEWMALSEADRTAITNGIENGSFTY